MTRAIALFSGGLDSILAIRLLTQQDVEILAVSFVTPFFGAGRAERAAADLGVAFRSIDITEPHLRDLPSPHQLGNASLFVSRLVLHVFPIPDTPDDALGGAVDSTRDAPALLEGPPLVLGGRVLEEEPRFGDHHGDIRAVEHAALESCESTE